MTFLFKPFTFIKMSSLSITAFIQVHCGKCLRLYFISLTEFNESFWFDL